MEHLTIKQIMELMPGLFIPEKAGNLNTLVQYRFSGIQPGEWLMRISDGVCTVQEGVTEQPKITIDADSQSYIDMIEGRLNPMMALMQKKIRILGDQVLAMKFTSFFKKLV